MFFTQRQHSTDTEEAFIDIPIEGDQLAFLTIHPEK